MGICKHAAKPANEQKKPIEKKVYIQKTVNRANWKIIFEQISKHRERNVSSNQGKEQYNFWQGYGLIIHWIRIIIAHQKVRELLNMSEKLSTSVSSASGNPSFHNDRKRRDNINERIQELLDMIPEEYFDSYYGKNSETGTPVATPGFGGSVSSTPATPGAGNKSKGSGTRDGKPNKGQILTQTVEFITRLQNGVDAKNREEVDLMTKVINLSKKTGTIMNDIDLEHTSAEVELGKIGVGPLAGVNPPEQGTKGQESQYEYGGYSEYGNTA